MWLSSVVKIIILWRGLLARRLKFEKIFLVSLILFPVPAPLHGATNLIRNPGFEVDANRSGNPAEWITAGDPTSVTQTLSIDKGRQGGHSARLSCTRFAGAVTSSSHAMLAQLNVPVNPGTSYRLSFWARAEAISNDLVHVSLRSPTMHKQCGFNDDFMPTFDWQLFEFVFQASRDCPQQNRLQIWFASMGTLWIDDVELIEAPSASQRPTKIVSPGHSVNLVPNGSFECGSAGWGSEARDEPSGGKSHWATPMNRLFGQIDSSRAFHGKTSLRIDMGDATQPVAFFDYLDLWRQPIQAPLAANIGFFEVEPGKPYTLSAYVMASEIDLPTCLGIRQVDGRVTARNIRASTNWQRLTFTFTPSTPWCYLIIGPDLRASTGYRNTQGKVSFWVDAVQLEQGSMASDFVTREPVEFGIETERPGNVFAWDEQVRFKLTIANASGAQARPHIMMRLTDFSDIEVWRATEDIAVPADGHISREILIPSTPERRGFLRLHVSMAGNEQTMRLAVIPEDRRQKTEDRGQGVGSYADSWLLASGSSSQSSSRFGINHAYPWPHLLDLSMKAGITWVRDWSLKWHDVEPAPGSFSFAETDQQIDRPLKQGMQVLGLLPFPSSYWASSSSAKDGGGRSQDDPLAQTGPAKSQGNRLAVEAEAPRDIADFERYVMQTVSHYRDRLTWFQVFNEPLYTIYSLPRKSGYDGAAYARFTQAFVQAAREANPQCRILGGIGGLSQGQIMEDFRTYFAAGGLKHVDALDIHIYPGIRPPEFAEELLEGLNSLMELNGGRKPIWLTECGYYADDEPAVIPMSHKGFNKPLPNEQVQAAYAVRWATIMFANGVDRIFYHAGTCSGINSDIPQRLFYKYAGEPRKIYAAQAVMAQIFPTSCRFIKRLALGDANRGYLFRDGQRLIAVVWSVRDQAADAMELFSDKLMASDIMGRRLRENHLPLAGTPFYVIGDDITPAAFEAGYEIVSNRK